MMFASRWHVDASCQVFVVDERPGDRAIAARLGSQIVPHAQNAGIRVAAVPA